MLRCLQNGHTKVYKEVNEDGTVTEYQEEQYLVEGDELAGDGETTSEVVVLQDDEDCKVYQVREMKVNWDTTTSYT